MMARAATQCQWCFVAFSLLLALNLLHEARAVISGPRDNGLIEPVEFELREGEQLSDVGRRAGKPRLHKRQSEENSTDRIGTTFALHGDHHNHGLVHWTGHPSEAIFMLTRQRDRLGYSTESWLWRSTNYGVTFENETYKFDNGSVLEWYYISPNNNILIFTDRIHHRIYVTEDEGETYDGYDVPFRPDTLRFQSSNAPGSENGSLPEHVLGFDSSDASLWVTRDLGRRGGNSSWIRLGQNVIRYAWRVLDTDVEANTTVYFEQTFNSSHSRLFVAESPYTNVTEFSDIIGVFEQNTFVLTHQYMFVQKNISTNAQQYSSPLWVSRNRGPFTQAQFPLQKQEKHYSVVDASEGEVFIAVYHNFNNTNLYLSEEEGLKYSLSLEYIISPPENQWIGGYPTFDVHVVEGIVGTYIANRRVPTSEFGATVISFDKGGEWNLLTPPAVNRDGYPIVCPQPDCSLHLHMESDITSGYESILSQDSAVGLIMALGNTGPTLNTNTSALRVYFSHDGGFTWQEVEEYFWEFEFAAQGSIIVMVPKRSDTKLIKWSCDEGANLNSTEFADIEIRVVAMFTERGEKARHATIFGYQGPGFREWLVIDLDFSSVVPNQCLPDEYYAWVPTDERPGSRCLLGEVVEYERRKPDHCCYIDPSYEKPTDKHACDCAFEDFECDFGFERVNLNSPCTPMPGIVWPPAPPVCPENETYSFTSGYRKVAGDRCVVGNETSFLPIVQPCPIMPPLGLFIQTDPPVIQAQVAVNFTLTQLLGAMFVTVYTWDFGDGSNVTSTGFEQSQVQPHTYSKPGDFIVTITATNEGGEASFELPISVLDPLDKAIIILPAFTQNGSVPSGVQLVFQSDFTTKFSTSHTGNLMYTWDFDDPNDPTKPSTASGTHIFVKEGEYTVELTIHSPVNSESSHIEITVYAAITADDVMIFSDGVEGDSYVHVGKAINFTLEKTHDDVVIPRGTAYTWHVHNVNTTDNTTSHDKELLYDFPALGSYEISVVGEHNGVSVSVDKTVMAEYDIGAINVDMRQTVRYKRTTTANVTVMRVSNEPYMGSVDVMVHFNGSTVPIEGTVSIDDSNKQLMFKLESAGELKLMFVASNDISSQPQGVTVNVARMSQYGSVRFVFLSSLLPPEYKSPAWQNELRNSIIDYVTENYNVKAWQVEVSPLEELEEQEGRKEREENSLLVADTYIVPFDLKEDDIDVVLDAAMDLVIKSNSGEIKLAVDGQTVSVDEGILNPDSVTGAMVVDVGEKTEENKTIYLGLGLGLGMGLLLVLAFAVLMVYVTYRYHRKYNRLNVRYSRLQQSPVRFTFTQRGEMVEEDDDDDMDDDDTTAGLDGPLEAISTMEMEKKTSPT